MIMTRKRKTMTVIGAAVMAGLFSGCGLFSALKEEPSGTVLYVSPTGSDLNSGSRRQPFATLPHARDAARMRPQPVTVRLLSGTHVLSEPLVLTPADSGVTFEAAPGAAPVVSGGLRVEGWRKHNDRLWVADVPWLRKQAEPFAQLFVNGGRRPCARTPNEGAYFYTKRLTLTPGDPGQCLGLTYNKEDTLPWIG